ncbi:MULTISPECIES: nuclear transport factor 2 family protein [Methylobacterium]|jgi:steroid delta-isomerase|uniref:nuclear transport factor 2 family protein n=1 Tax=Methylobacterium TaxID=407 RepID=UPI0008ED8AE1|nr:MULTISPECIES: nuclear transport factor 2 family protein [Methylobacterium]MBZ6411896.1 nuclear transport factor 2 family protein [Methylobacterium sp.]MBK3398203.1 nuclear transport factor 2 family protein [Methylobacterium ajmalii]MBK3407461.1 nuclear transport factor 2 family protein [Methylobacterium ajmalii]MBK3420422.1 nuclear transport factor 2 family protein [Methylobacterium ajmalii]SFF17848.1 SnoaL-like domain-containing protein [Methylobacterium sp. yr596]
MSLDAAIRHIHAQWHDTVVRRDIEGLMALYADDAVFESPLVWAALPEGGTGILKGKIAIRDFFDRGFRSPQNGLGRWYRTGVIFSDGQQLAWEYPRQTPDGDQIDLMEMIDVSGGLIAHHRVYWGWVGVRTLSRLPGR